MGFLALQRLMSLQRDRQRRERRNRRYRPLNGSRLVASVDEGRHSPSGHGDSQAAKTIMCSIPALPEDILHRIHSLLPLRAAARAACLSHAFLLSWRCRPVLVLNKHTIGSNANAHQENLSCIIDNILRNHSGVGIKILKLELYGIVDACHYLDRWLQIAVTPGIEKLTLTLCRRDNMKYNIPCTVLSDGFRNSIRCLQLSFCTFHPTAELGPWRKLTSLRLHSVRISGDELEYFLSNSPALRRLDLSECPEIICLKIPCVQLHYLEVSCCSKLRVIESKARNLFSFILKGERVKVLLGETMQMKYLCMRRSDLVCYARAEFPSNMPELETLSIGSGHERVNTPMLPTKFLFLKHLSIFLSLMFCPSYDYFSLVSFLDASPSLETWLLDVGDEGMPQESIFGGSSQLRQMAEQHHGCLKSVKIKGFNSAKGLVELVCYILQNAKSLECLTLDTTYGDPKCDTEMSGGQCTEMSKGFLIEARRGAAAIRTCIEDKVPSTVKLTVVEHCRRCHADKFI